MELKTMRIGKICMEKKLNKKEMCLKIANYLNQNKLNSHFVQSDEQLAKFIMATYSVERVNKMYEEVINKKAENYINEKHLQNL